MRLPWGSLVEVSEQFIDGRTYCVLGSIATEERCVSVPLRLFGERCRCTRMLHIQDPEDAFPDFRFETARKVDGNRRVLRAASSSFEEYPTELLATEDELSRMTADWDVDAEIVVLDISALPKRYFCFFLKRFLRPGRPDNVIVTYTQAGPGGYAPDHLAEDPMTPEHLPGFSPPLPPRGDTLAVSIGFEPLSIASILRVFRDSRKGIKVILSYPPNGPIMRRAWNTLREIASEIGGIEMVRGGIEVVAGWDAEHVFRTLTRWGKDCDGLSLAPYGPKPHSLGLALFAIRNDCGMLYTQPKAYNPNYSMGQGPSWAYVVKWDGIACFDRMERK